MSVVETELSYSTDDLVAASLMVKACPFCGSLGVEAINTRCASPWFVVCDRCRAIGPCSETLEMAVALVVRPFDRGCQHRALGWEGS